MPTKNSERDYKKEYERDHSTKKDKLDRAARNKARKDKGLKKGDPREVNHKVPLSKGGSRTSKKNQEVVSRKTNRKQSNKVK